MILMKCIQIFEFFKWKRKHMWYWSHWILFSVFHMVKMIGNIETTKWLILLNFTLSTSEFGSFEDCLMIRLNSPSYPDQSCIFMFLQAWNILVALLVFRPTSRNRLYKAVQQLAFFLRQLCFEANYASDLKL